MSSSAITSQVPKDPGEPPPGARRCLHRAVLGVANPLAAAGMQLVKVADCAGDHRGIGFNRDVHQAEAQQPRPDGPAPGDYALGWRWCHSRGARCLRLLGDSTSDPPSRGKRQVARKRSDWNATTDGGG
jgi:hypothetical protein